MEPEDIFIVVAFQCQHHFMEFRQFCESRNMDISVFNLFHFLPSIVFLELTDFNESLNYLIENNSPFICLNRVVLLGMPQTLSNIPDSMLG